MTHGNIGARTWYPTTEKEISNAIAEGLLRETHHFDVKREVGSTDGERKNIARHAASLAIDGGALLIGVEELKHEHSWRLAPQQLDGLPESAEQIVAQLVDPPLYVSVTEIPSEADPAVGYLVLHVDESPLAPHMVDGVYYGRGERTRTRLSDAQVVRHHTRREPIERIAEVALDEEIARDHVQVDDRQRGHLYAIAQPLTAPRGMARSVLSASRAGLIDLTETVEQQIPRPPGDFDPTPQLATNYSRRAQGAALFTFQASGAGRTVSPEHARSGWDSEEALLDIEFREDGGVRLLVGRMTAEWGAAGADHAIADGLGVGYALRLVRWAKEVGDRSGYHGSWVFGLHADRLRGLQSHHFSEQRGFRSQGVAYDADTYREVTTASHREMVSQPGAVAERLVGRLIRALATDSRYIEVLTPPAIPIP